MTLLKFTTVLALPLALLACVETERTTVIPPVPDNSPTNCGANLMSSYIGQPVSALPERPANQPQRILRPNGIMTMDLQPNRLNVEVDIRDRIKGFYCG